MSGVGGRPLAIDLFTGLHGWSEGLIAEGFRVVGYDIEDMSAQFGHEKPEHFELVIQDVLTLHGSQFKDAALIVASPPCQKYSYMSMPWSLAKAKAAAIRADTTGQALEDLNRLFHACFRIQAEASLAAGRHIPMVVENVRGAQPWVGRARAKFGSFYLWGDVPAIMPVPIKAVKAPGHSMTQGAPKWNMHHSETVGAIGLTGIKNGGDWFGSGKDCSLQRHFSGTKQPGISGKRVNGKGDAWLQDGAARHGSKSIGRKAASAMIAKIPLPLCRHIAAIYRPTPHHGASLELEA